MSLLLNVRGAMPAGGALWVETARTNDRSPGVRLLLGTARLGTAADPRAPRGAIPHDQVEWDGARALDHPRHRAGTMRGRSSFVLRPAMVRHESSGCREATSPWLTRDGARFPPAAHRAPWGAAPVDPRHLRKGADADPPEARAGSARPTDRACGRGAARGLCADSTRRVAQGAVTRALPMGRGPPARNPPSTGDDAIRPNV
jgi:hypothetical protein